MGNYVGEMLLSIFRLQVLILYHFFRMVGGLLFGYWRTRHDTRGYRPTRLTAPLDHQAFSYRAFVITVPKSHIWNPEQHLRFMANVWSFGRVLFQIVGEPSGIVFRIVMLDGVQLDSITNLIYSYYPESRVEITWYSPDSAPPVPHTNFSIPLVSANIFPAPGMTVDQIHYFDPLTTFTQAISQLRAGERVVYSVAVLDEAPGANEAGMKLVTQSDIHPLAYTSLDGVYIAEARKSKGFDRIPVYEWSIQKMLEGKLNHPLYHVLVMVQVRAPERERAGQLMTELLSHLMQFANYPFNALVPPENKHKDEVHVETIEDPSMDEDRLKLTSDLLIFLYGWADPTDKRQSWKKVLTILQAEEIAALWHLPYEGFSSPAIEWLTRKQKQLPKALRDQPSGVRVGVNRFGGQEYPVVFPLEDRSAHCAIIGKTGTGKSSLLHHLIHADIQAGRGVCVIDPHGTLVQSLLRGSIPTKRMHDVVVLDVSNTVDGVPYPLPLNLLAKPPGVARDVAAGMLMSVLTKVYDGFGETQMAHTLHMALLTLSESAQPTLLDVGRLFEDQAFRQALVERSDNLVVRRFWSSFDQKSPAQQEQMTYPVLRRLDGFYSNNTLLTMTCHPDPMPFGELLRHNKIILVSLAADDARIPTLERLLLGSVVVSQIQMAALAGAVTQAPYFLYIDEAQHFVTTALPQMLSEARKYGLGLVLANQYLHQLTGGTAEALEGNVGAFVAFEVGESDARNLALYLKPEFVASDLVALGQYRAAVSLRVKGERQPAFSLETLPPPALPDELVASAREQVVRRFSVVTYTPKPYSEVSQWINHRYAPDPPPSTPTRGTDDFIEPYA